MTKKPNAPLYDDELEAILSPYRYFKGVVMSDELKGLLQDMKRHQETRAGLVMNLEKSSQGGSHWVAIYIDLNASEIDYYDSFGRVPPPPTMAQLVSFARPKRIRVRYNTEVHQTRLSHRCGYHVVRFLIEMFKTGNFIRATTLGGVRSGEQQARRLEKVFQMKGFI